jgi:hypothetical protein
MICSGQADVTSHQISNRWFVYTQLNGVRENEIATVDLRDKKPPPFVDTPAPPKKTDDPNGLAMEIAGVAYYLN